MTKRLFVFAGFDKDNIVDNTLLYYVRALSNLGDIIFVMDNDLPTQEIKKISGIPNVLYAKAVRHNEYDFGSYKRGYIFAKEKKLLKKYDWMYFVNDSVYGPMSDLEPLLVNLEKSGSDLIGMASDQDDSVPLHVQSWFVGFSKTVFTSDFFDSFVQKITHLDSKRIIVMKYEIGLSGLVMRHGFKMTTVLKPEHNNIFENPRLVLSAGVPFVKKNAVAKLRKLYFLYPYMDDYVLADYISEHMKRDNIDMVKDSYHTVFKLRFLGIPLFHITAKKTHSYKVYVFKYIPVLKIEKQPK
jgi:lipopolysaccharide biosynthesis protein